MAANDPMLVPRITRMINGAYEYERVSEEDIENRLEMGDAGPRANRVLHLAHRDGQLVGSCSSTHQPPWTAEGCGHWGLLVVDTAHQGTGVASALVKAAEERLAGACQHVQIEYDYLAGDEQSERLMKLYEGKYGFTCVQPVRRRGGGQSQFRKCVKELPRRLVAAQRPLHLRRIAESLSCQLAVEVDDQPGEIDRVGQTRRLHAIPAACRLAPLNGRQACVLLYNAADSTYTAQVLPLSTEERLRRRGRGGGGEGGGAGGGGGSGSGHGGGGLAQGVADTAVDVSDALAAAAEMPVEGSLVEGRLVEDSLVEDSLVEDEATEPASAPLLRKRVRIRGLTSRRDLNGASGVATSYDPSTRRYGVKLDTPQSGQVKVRNVNLAAVADGDVSIHDAEQEEEETAADPYKGMLIRVRASCL